MVKLTVKTDRIGMEIYFEPAVIHLYNCLPEARSTFKTLSVDKELGEKVNNQEHQIADLHCKTNIGGGSKLGNISMSQLKKCAKNYQNMGERNKFSADERQKIFDDRKK